MCDSVGRVRSGECRLIRTNTQSFRSDWVTKMLRDMEQLELKIICRLIPDASAFKKILKKAIRDTL